MKMPVGVGVGLGVGSGNGVGVAEGVGSGDGVGVGDAAGVGVAAGEVAAGEVAAGAGVFVPLPPQPARATIVARESALINAVLADKAKPLPPVRPGRK